MTAIQIGAQFSERVALTDVADVLGISYRGAASRATRESWAFDEVTGIGGKKRYYPISSLPRDVIQAIHLAAMNATPVERAPVAAKSIAADLAPLDPNSLTQHQLDVEAARDRIFRFVEGFQGSNKAALAWLNEEKAAGRLTGPMAWAMAHAWDKPRAANKLTPKTYYNWLSEKEKRGRAVPKKIQQDMSVKPWHALVVNLKRRPQGSTLAWIAEQVAEQWNPDWGNEIPTKRAIDYFLREKFSVIDQLKGRFTGSALRAHKAYTPRTSVGMRPWDEVHADGWNTHFTAPHPVTGEFVTYEVWHAHDVATRYVPPFGLGLTENYEVIAKCIENAIRCGGVMAILQTDSTAIVKRSARLKTDPATALADRAGFTIVHPQEVGNSQANGIAENFNKYMDQCSRELATYQAKDMDQLTFKRVKKLTAKMVTAGAAGDQVARAQIKREAEKMGKGKVFDSYAEAVAWLDDKREKFNHRPHGSLPKIRDPETGKQRHQSPFEALQEHRADGWQPVMLDDLLLIDMFWTHERRKVVRAAVTGPNGLAYYNQVLGDWEGKYVVVAFDPDAYKQVWVKTDLGDLICVADFVEATAYRTQTFNEAAQEKRALAQIKHSEQKIERIRARTPGMVIDAQDGTLLEDMAPRTIKDFLDVEARPVVEPLRTIADFLPAQGAPKEKTLSREETVMWLYSKEEEEPDEADKKVAAG